MNLVLTIVQFIKNSNTGDTNDGRIPPDVAVSATPYTVIRYAAERYVGGTRVSCPSYCLQERGAPSDASMLRVCPVSGNLVAITSERVTVWETATLHKRKVAPSSVVVPPAFTLPLAVTMTRGRRLSIFISTLRH